MYKKKCAILGIAFSTSALLVAPAFAEEVTPFAEIMSLMEGADITYERIGHYKRPFKVFKKGKHWILKQTKANKQSRIKDAGENKISATYFPPGWTVNGTWVFKKIDDKCRIDHAKGGMVMRWDCGS